jgi:hypothetical protein
MFDEYIEKLANNKEIYLKVKVSPSAGKTELLGVMSDGTIKIAVAATPENNKANLELLKFLAKELEVRKYQIRIVSGASEKTKLIKIGR